MMGFTEPGQARQPLIQEVEKEIGYSVEQRMKGRQDIDARTVLPGANAWKVLGRPFRPSLMSPFAGSQQADGARVNVRRNCDNQIRDRVNQTRNGALQPTTWAACRR
jgi:hypothetical protein